MLDFLILTVLLDGKNNLYGIKKIIDDDFSLFVKVSFGSIHPAAKKLELGNFISVKKHITTGGQRKSVYSITTEGKDCFVRFMLEDLPENPPLATQIVNIKLMSLSKVEDNIKSTVINSLIQHFESLKLNARNIIISNRIKDEYQLKYTQHHMDTIGFNLNFLHALQKRGL